MHKLYFTASPLPKGLLYIAEENTMKWMLPGRFAWTFLFLLSLIASGLASADSFSRLYVFGDSLSDTGNAASVVNDLPPPYYKNRFSNGPVAVEVLAKKLGLSADASLYLPPMMRPPDYFSPHCCS